MSARPVFLERRTYRRRRLGDAARLLPFAGAALFLAPALLAPQSVTTASMSFVFAVWVVLILAAAALSRRLRATRKGDE